MKQKLAGIRMASWRWRMGTWKRGSDNSSELDGEHSGIENCRSPSRPDVQTEWMLFVGHLPAPRDPLPYRLLFLRNLIDKQDRCFNPTKAQPRDTRSQASCCEH
jgi:hypothetical protein